MSTVTKADAGAVGPGRGGRMSRQRKRDAVLRLLRLLRLLRGEDLGCEPNQAIAGFVVL
jgi:hypothetical protein